MTDKPEKKRQRPVLVTVLCLVAAYGISMLVFQATSRNGAERFQALLGADPSLPYFLIFRISLTAVAMVGYWFMKRWGVCVYSFMAVTTSVWTLFLTIRLTWYEYMAPIFIMGVGYYYWKRMT
jgi:hypothetical protein